MIVSEEILEFVHTLEPDVDGYSKASIPREIMIEYIRKYAKKRGWTQGIRFNWKKFMFESNGIEEETPEKIIKEYYGRKK